MYLVGLTNLVALFTMLCVAVNGPAKMSGTALPATLTTLNLPCWLDWLATDALLADPRYTPEVWRLTSKNVNDFKRKAALHPGKLWLFWNEPEHTDQANMPPEIAASLTISYTQVLAENGTWACCGNLIDGNGLAWLDSYLAHGGPLPNVWHIHIYGATDQDEWNAYLNYWWAWWKQHGAGKPVIISETSLMWQPAAKQAALLRDLLRYDDKNVQQIYWFSAFYEPSVPSWSESRLLNNDLTKTELGKIYAPDLLATATDTATPTVTITDTPIGQAMTPTPLSSPTATPTPPVSITATPAPTETGDAPVGTSLTYKLYLPLCESSHD